MVKCANCGTPSAIQIQVASGKGVAERWRSQYQRDGKWTDTAKGSSGETYNRLCALGPDPDIAAVAEIIGNKSWSYLSCRGCGESVERAVVLGEDYSEQALVCQACLQAALTAISR